MTASSPIHSETLPAAKARRFLPLAILIAATAASVAIGSTLAQARPAQAAAPAVQDLAR